jgi:FAD dependent oxidoreductase TIGR03364
MSADEAPAAPAASAVPARGAGRAVVAGGGIVGTWHALELAAAGFSVEQLEAEAGPTGASVRNFGLVWVSGRRSGAELDAARRARRRWEEIGAAVPGVGFRPMTSLTVATDDVARAVMEDFAARPEAAARSISFLGPEEVRTCNPAVRGEVAGALHCAEDAVVEPRRALQALRDHLAAVHGARYRFHPGCRVVAAEPHALVDATGTRWAGDLIVLATGAAYDHLPGSAPVAARLRRVRLQMLQTAPFAARLTTSLADADSLRYYPAYESAPLARLGEPSRVAAEHHLQLLLVQRPDGALTIGDTHAYEEPFDFALCEDPTRELLERARRILGSEPPPVQRRWEGVYAQCRDGDVCLREEIEPGVWVVTGPGGRGMTCSPAIAADTLRVAGVAA